MANNRKGRDQGVYYLSRGQLVLLAAGFTVTSLIVFFFGVFIGQGIEERKLLKKEEPLVKVPVEPLLQGSGSAPAAKEEITFYDTLAKAAKSGRPASSEPEKAAKPPPPVEKAAEPTVKEAKSPAREALPSKVSEQAGKKTQERVWTVQVNAFPQERDATRLAKRLKDKGYDAYVTSSEIKGRTWYRVRVGRFTTRNEAKSLQEELKTKENLSKTMTVSR